MNRSSQWCIQPRSGISQFRTAFHPSVCPVHSVLLQKFCSGDGEPVFWGNRFSQCVRLGSWPAAPLHLHLRTAPIILQPDGCHRPAESFFRAAASANGLAGIVHGAAGQFHRTATSARRTVGCSRCTATPSHRTAPAFRRAETSRHRAVGAFHRATDSSSVTVPAVHRAETFVHGTAKASQPAEKSFFRTKNSFHRAHSGGKRQKPWIIPKMVGTARCAVPVAECSVRRRNNGRFITFFPSCRTGTPQRGIPTS